MDGKKVYQIQINGISESISAVDALNKQLDALEKRIKALENSNVKVNTTSKGGGGNASVLNEEAAVQKEINKLKQEGATLDAKIVATQDEVYKRVDATKQLYKEVVADQKALAAQERLVADAYSNTMVGIKQKLADLKSVHFTTDLSSDEFKQQAVEINALTEKLKELEKEYGVYSRDVGNYANGVREGLKGLAIQVGDTTQHFDNAKQALKTLQGELRTLQVKKDQGMLLSEEELKRFQELPSVVAQLKSSIQDAGKPMDALFDTMQSFVAIAQTTKGLSALFGFDDSEIQRSIQQLVALQNALQGLQTIQKQMQSQEGIGKLFKAGDAAIKSFTDKLFGVDKAAKAASASVATVGTAGKTAATGLGTASVAANTATKSFSLASAAATALRVVLNALGIGLVIGAISVLVSAVGKLIDKQQEAKKYQEDLNKAINEGNKEYAKASLEMSTLEKKLNSFNGTKKQEKQLVEELNRKYGDSIGQYKSVKEWKEAIIKKAAAYAQALRTEAEAQALLNLYTQQFVELEEAKQRQQQKDSSWVGWLEKAVDTVAKGVTKVNKQWGALATSMSAGLHLMLDDNIDQMEANLEKTRELYDQKVAELGKIQAEYGLGDNAPKITENGKKTKAAVEKLQNEINELELRLMKEGLNKKLKQLDEEERQTINKLKENGRKSGEEIQKIQRAYAQLRTKEIQEYLKTLEESLKQSAKNIENIQFDINTKEIDNQLDKLQNKFDEFSKIVPHINDLITAQEFDTSLVGKGFQRIMRDVSSSVYGVKVNLWEDDIRKMFQATTDMLKSGFVSRNLAAKQYYDETIEQLKNNIKQQGELNEQRINTQIEQEKQAEKDRYNLQFEGLQEERIRLDKEIELYEKRKDKDEKTLEGMKANRDKFDKQMQQALDQHTKRLTQITEEGNNAIKKNEIETLNEIQSAQERYYNIQLSNYRDFQSKLNDEISKNPVASKGWGIVNINQTRKNYDEIIKASEVALKQIEADKEKLEKDFKDGLIGNEAYNTTKNQLNDLEKEIRNGMAVTKEANANLIADFVSSIQMYLQAAMDSFQTIMSAVWDAQDIAFDKEQEQIDKDNEKLEKALDKQQEIVEKHKSAIDSIEDELATSRGDRRQHLIDQLNAEMEAQRRAAEEEKKIQKEKEAIEKRQDELEKERKKAQYKRDLLQAIVNGAMAVTMAAINTWPIPAIPMMALAASTTAAQVAIMAANKPYRVGGQLEGGLVKGKRHTQGGVPVGNTGIEVEGDEMIIRRESTMPNIDLLNYINKSQRKLDLDDFIDFYSSGKAKKNFIASSPRAKYASGGVLPTLNNDYNFDDRLLTAFEDYSNRPIYVAVTEIESKMDSVRNVRALAGMRED